MFLIKIDCKRNELCLKWKTLHGRDAIAELAYLSVDSLLNSLTKALVHKNQCQIFFQKR